MCLLDIIGIDKKLFSIINGSLHNEWLDAFLPLVRSPQMWIPLYLFLIVFVIVNGNGKKYWWLLFFGLLPVLTDYVSSDIIKEHFFRLRPCNDPEWAGSMRFLLSYKPQSSSFTSSHATNHFALATFFYRTLKGFIGKYSLLFFLWAALICWAQVYVGVHYPGDVLAGALVGYVLGYAVSELYQRKFQLHI